jgi:hypothetical protein
MEYLRIIWDGTLNAFGSMGSSLVNWLSFSSEMESMVETVNHRIDEPPTKIGQRPDSHPGGFARILGKRRLNMASAYIKISKDHSPDDVAERLAALKMLVEEALHAKTINMPINTARVQIALMKVVVKSRRNRRKQLEALTDFGLASFGHEAVIREFLNQHHLIEVPDIGKPLSDLDMGWDDHVHDFLSEGRKTPTQVILDAFVKGISRLTLVHSTLDQPQLIHEAISAGHLLGVNVRIGIEFSVGPKNQRRHYMFIPPPVRDSREFFEFFSEKNEFLVSFLHGLQINSISRRKTMEAALERFNNVMRPKINTGYNPDSPCYLEALAWSELDEFLTCGQVNRVHLAELLFHRMKRAFHARVLELKTQVSAAAERFRNGKYSEWEMKNISAQYQKVRSQFESMSPDSLMTQYLDNRDVLDYDSAFPTEKPLLENLLDLGGDILWIHPLELGLKRAMQFLLEHSECLTIVEAINLRDSVNRNPDDIILFSQFINSLNNHPSFELCSLLEQNGLTQITLEEAEQAKKRLKGRKIIPVCGSDSTGRDPAIPGMGFIQFNQIPPKVRKIFTTHHYRLARPVAALILSFGNASTVKEHQEDHDIICMGKIGQPIKNLVGDEPRDDSIGFFQFWQYLNPTLKNVIRISIGFTAALSWFHFQFALGLGCFFAFLWLFITGFRNFLVDMIAASGSHFKSWNLRNVNLDNLAKSLLWTGFSVPLLGTVKTQFDAVWPYAHEGLLFETIKFWLICLANGLYIFSHNTLRKFDRKIVRANFFRTVFAWPFATLFSPFGNSLGLPSIVQAKFWSDFVGGLIEGSGKFKQRFVLRQRDLKELLPLMYSQDREIRITAMLDILFIWSCQPRGKTCLGSLLLQDRPIKERFRDWWHSREVPEEIFQARRRYFQYYERLSDLFMDPGCLSNFTRFILQRYTGNDAVALTGVVGDQLEPFRSWLRWLKGRFDAKIPEPLDMDEILPPNSEEQVPTTEKPPSSANDPSSLP